MAAGNGISHSERFDTIRQSGGHLHGIQARVVLPEAIEATSPNFVHSDAAQLASHRERSVSIRVIAGQAYGMKSPVTTHSPLFPVPPSPSVRAEQFAVSSVASPWPILGHVDRPQ
jgi:redox-sensitive bicupin YhaK (pirin superfamily)